MHEAIREAESICKTLLRNGFDAHVINASLQDALLGARDRRNEIPVVEIACEPDFETLAKVFPKAAPDGHGMAILEENGMIFRFYPMDSATAVHPELGLLRLTPEMARRVDPENRNCPHFASLSSPDVQDNPYDGFTDPESGEICLLGLPDATLRHNYLLAIRALRFAANFDLPIEKNTWMAIVRASGRVLDYVPARDIMEEWRKVAAESMHRFVRLLHDAHILQGLIPEVAALSRVPQQNNRDGMADNVFEHTLECMRLYPEEGLHYDWLGAMAMLFHDVGKLFTVEYFNGRWTYYQHHRVGAQVTRKILRRLHFAQEGTDLICHLVNNHMRFHFMMTDRGIRRFRSVGENDRLIAMARADVLSRDGSFTSFNHNLKYLDRAETPEQLLEPLLNGNEIMEETRLSPGPLVGAIRDALLEAQKAGLVKDRESALQFVRARAAQAGERGEI